jgi:hypothetical protein
MIYKIKEYKNKLIEKAFKDGMREFNKFFDFNWNLGIPNICVLNSRKEIDIVKNYKSEEWLIGWADGSSHNKLSEEEYAAYIKHELCHIFYYKVSKGYHEPAWLKEGMAIYLSGQLKYKKPIKNFSNFLEFYKKGVAGVYAESGMAVKLLVENFDNKKLLNLIYNIRKIDNKKEFSKLFKKIYGFDLNYKNFNNLLHKK